MGRDNAKLHHPIFAPLNVPLHRRMETLSLLIHYCSPGILAFTFYISWCLPPLWPLLIIYTVFFFLFDKTPSNGGCVNRYSKWVRGSYLLNNLSRYFPVNIHKTVDLKPTFKVERSEVLGYPTPFNILPDFICARVLRLSKTRKFIVEKEIRIGPRYMFCYHPHGFIAWGATSVFATEGCGFSKEFPGIRCFLLTLVNQFRIPFFRDYIMSLGLCSVTKQNIKSLLLKDQSLCIVVGGASESLLAKPGSNLLVLQKRKGFIKQALQVTGKSHSSFIDQLHNEENLMIVPVFCFGETDLYNIFDTSLLDDHKESYFRQFLRTCQLWLKNTTGFTLPLVFARGIFNYDFGLLPFRKELNVVFGEPINIERKFGRLPGDDISEEEIEYFHDLYIKNLQKLFNDNKSKYSKKGDSELIIVE